MNGGIKISLNMMEQIFVEMGVREQTNELDLMEKLDLHDNILDKFDIIGSFKDLNCEELERAWELRSEEVKEFILEWLKLRNKQRKRALRVRV